MPDTPSSDTSSFGTSFLALLFVLIGFVLWCLVHFFVIRAAVVSALERAGAKLGPTNQLLGAQADLTQQVAKHLIAQSDIMLLQAKQSGLTEDQLAGVHKQLDERKAVDSGFTMPTTAPMPTSLPFK